MSERHDEYRDWAGAYVLGALEPADRRDFEIHLAACPICTADVQALLPLHGLLAQIDRNDLETGPNATPDAARSDAIAARAAEETLRLRSSQRRWQRVAMAATAAAAVVLLAAGIVAVWPGSDSDEPSWSEGPVVAAEIRSTEASSAAISTSSRGWGTEIQAQVVGLPERARYQLWVVDSDDNWTVSGTWGPTPSGGADITGATSVTTDALHRVVITSDDREEILVDATV